MYRQSPGRNHRSKGIKVKNVLQVCLLLAVCFWLIYQVKHSHDKKKEFDQSDGKASLSSDELRILGRKGIQTRLGGTPSKDENHDELSDEEGEEVDEVDDKKAGVKEDDETDEVEDKKADVKEDDETDEVEDKKVDVKEDDETDEVEDKKGDVKEDEEIDEVEDKKGDVKEDDETDEHEREKSDAEVDREDGDENETQNTDTEEVRAEIEKESGAEETDHEAREEHYKADDASSAVTQNQETFKSENGEIKVDVLDNPGNSSSPNNTVTQESNDRSTTNTTIEDHSLLSENVMETNAQGNLTESEFAGRSDLLAIGTERANNSILNVESTHLDSNSTVSDAKEFRNLSNYSAPANVEAGNSTETLLANNNEIEGERSDTSDETTENPEEVQQDSIDESDTSNSLHEKDVRTDLETLPEIRTEGANIEEDAAE